MPFIEECPIGCEAPLEESSFVSGDVLLRCSKCGQLIRQSSEDYYIRSMEGFNTPNGTSPTGRNIESSHKRFSKHLRKIRAISRRMASGDEPRLLDIGCSSGSFLHFAKKFGYAVSGVEPAPLAAATAIRSGLDVKQGFLEHINYPDNHFDVITMFEVIEHVKEPVDLLRECHRILTEGGIMVIGTGNTDSWTSGFMKGEWDYFEGPGHISFFNPISMRKLASESGFDLLRLDTRRVKICRREKTSQAVYFLSKIATELLSIPARLFNKGHDALFFLKKAAP
ncbi:MAG TPA: class I SAM-dependent methyltransferase [Thermodesulfovibrionales bacterium]|nr:class I SAM-dependent methyltransferase [Thermodesulfovibrionales bacterium]